VLACEVEVTLALFALFRWNTIVPPWLEILLDLVGFGGFIGLAVWHKAPRKDDESVRR
jgi:hypothetical protein